MSNTYGKTWWGLQWLNTLSNIDYDNRLPRGKSYANKGSVTKIIIKGNRIEAKVTGSRPKPYNVDITLPPFFEPELGNFISQLAKKPTIISKLLNRELDPEVLTIAENLGLKVFPKQWTDFKMQCSCPDWAVPCKHLAAVVYKVSAEIDNNPFLVFELHQVNLIEELNKLGIFVNVPTSEIPKITDLYYPAVEAQATDRAYRIGQKSNVMVHRFITKNTFEEKINDMIQAKKALAEMTVSTGENWIRNLSNKELKELFTVS